jgi:hypothetical protein
MSPFGSRAKFEQSVVPWDRRALSECPRCSSKFSMLGVKKKTNCRLCGDIVCESDECSLPIEVSLGSVYSFVDS